MGPDFILGFWLDKICGFLVCFKMFNLEEKIGYRNQLGTGGGGGEERNVKR